jgi:hypothetical protein
VPRGTPLTITYGGVPNSRLLAQYGFCLEVNPYDTAGLSYTLDRKHWLHQFGASLTGGYSTVSFELPRTPDKSHVMKLLSFLRLLALPDAAAARGFGLVPGKLDAVPVLDAGSERAALLKLIEGCERALALFPNSVDADDELLRGGTLTPVQRCAVICRRGEKRLLQHAIGCARHALVALYLPQAERDAALTRRVQEGGDWAPYFTQLRDRLVAQTLAQEVAA